MSATPAMTVTELINALKKLRDEHGDLPIYYFDNIGYDADKIDIRVTDVHYKDEGTEELFDVFPQGDSEEESIRFPKRLVITGDTVWYYVSPAEKTNED